jgi:uncharacterized protein (DUF2235 family)
MSFHDQARFHSFPVCTLDRDTVESVGLLRSPELPFATSNTIVKTFRHALALDEHRAKFQPNRWNRTNAKEASYGTDGVASGAAAELLNAQAAVARTKTPTDLQLSTVKELEEKCAGQRISDIKEVWFAGCHCGACLTVALQSV